MEPQNISTPTVNIQLINKISSMVEERFVDIADIPDDLPEILALSEVLGGTNPVQTVLWCVIFIHVIENHKPNFAALANDLHIKTIEALAYLPELEQLQKKKLIRFVKPRRSENRTTMCFVVPPAVIDKIIYGKERRKVLEHEKDIFSLLNVFQEFFEEVDERVMLIDDLVLRIEDLKDDYAKLDYFKYLDSFSKLTQEERLLIIRLSVFAIHGHTVELNDILSDVTDQNHLVLRLKKGILEGTSLLVKENILRIEADNFKIEGRVSLTNEFLQKLFGKDAEMVILKNSESTKLVKPDTLSERTLYFNDSFQSKLDVIYELLQNDNYTRIQKQLSEENQTKGISMLFFGAAGTGKTATVYEIARKTDRAIFPVSVTDFKDPYFGQSEANLRDIFLKYNNIVKNSAVCPIMLLNEADSILSTRVSVKRSIDQTVNSLQNMLLEFFENNIGIIICTLNDHKNLDPAFSRRLLMKLEFEVPDTATKAKIWKLKLPKLSDDDAMLLAEKFDMSPGEMDNIARKSTIQRLVYNKAVSTTDIIAFCTEEKLDKNPRPKLGFNK